ncbi:hypothetical protein HPB47_008292 [Ixodes persulcatus]|uniref:Uncharacterized protein n=1 Tax=Ixodes persulcatus TaxID=34615 RepID=A0AC60P533_IXOPE|nr:hypothetical protein HPB47_008292 [Ixodes persulcatus]
MSGSGCVESTDTSMASSSSCEEEVEGPALPREGVVSCTTRGLGPRRWGIVLECGGFGGAAGCSKFMGSSRNVCSSQDCRGRNNQGQPGTRGLKQPGPRRQQQPGPQGPERPGHKQLGGQGHG